MILLETLKSKYGKNKKLPAGYELQALIALSHYPELLEEYVIFIFKNTLLPYASRPEINTLVIPFVKKKYKIIISNKTNVTRTPALLKNLSFEAQIGALGHELAHTTYYSNTNKIKIILDGIRYLSSSFKEKFEKMTDRIAIDHGLGPHIYAWSKEVYPTKMADGKRGEIYYTPEEILKIITAQNNL